MGVLLGKGGLGGNVLRIKPPMCITADDVDFAVDVLDRALQKVERDWRSDSVNSE
jgi:alanine-glyoxylate transaminase / (R)-3-amino-2-methylpropionate-pyruvate transaminase